MKADLWSANPYSKRGSAESKAEPSLVIARSGARHEEQSKWSHRSDDKVEYRECLKSNIADS